MAAGARKTATLESFRPSGSTLAMGQLLCGRREIQGGGGMRGGNVAMEQWVGWELE